VRRLVVGHGLRLAALGVTIGVGASLACARLLEPLLYRTSARDPRILSLTGAALLAVTMFASYIPALRATRIDPVEALRQL
jgi:ABC-type antimicrobial peptide transport system permease subunit